MSVQDLRTETNPARPTRSSTILVAALVVVAVVLGFVGGQTWSRHRSELGGWHTGLAQTGSRQIAIEFGGWTYGARGSVDRWIDEAGSWHEYDWPDCLDVSPGTQVPVRFQARAVTVDGVGWRSIVAIDCRAALGG